VNKKTPPVRKRSYNQSQDGVYGEFGSGANTKIIFIQTAIRPTDLGKTTLISDIPGSEAWPVPNLFQREVDQRRVSKSLLPYLQDQRRVKFFNPLTLTVLPFDPDKRHVLTAMPTIVESEEEEDGQRWRVIEMEGFYKYRHMPETPWGTVSWNDAVVKLVAIDGQHRLSALKRFTTDPKGDRDFQAWSIPVVILAFRGTGDVQKPRTILEVVRSIFVYINTEARVPNRARRILLSDESINDVCTQELLQLSHSNDVVEEGKRQLDRVPLLFYDWRGEEDEGRRIMAPSAVKRIEEINDWFERYIAGEDFSPQQETALGVQPVDPLKRTFIDRRLDAETCLAVRERVCADLIPAVALLLETFLPYRAYIAALRRLEKEYMDKSDVARHAFYYLRFGSHQAGEAMHKLVMQMYEELVREIEAIKAKEIKHPLNLDIGMRGVISAFGELREMYSAAKGKGADWRDFAGWFTKILNGLYTEGWFDIRGKPQVKVLLRHVIEDHNETVVNYRLEDAGNALGAYVALLVCAVGSRKRGIVKQDLWNEKHEEFTDRLEGCVMRGYRKEVRPQLRERYPKGGRELTEAVKQEAEKKTAKHMKKLEEAVETIVSGS
jgi:hypothetical protein